MFEDKKEKKKEQTKNFRECWATKMDVYKIDQSLTAGLGSAPAPDTLSPEVSFDAGSEFNLSFFDGPEDNSTQGFSDPGSVGSTSASPSPGTPGNLGANSQSQSASQNGTGPTSTTNLPLVQPGIVVKQGSLHFFYLFCLSMGNFYNWNALKFWFEPKLNQKVVWKKFKFSGTKIELISFEIEYFHYWNLFLRVKVISSITFRVFV